VSAQCRSCEAPIVWAVTSKTGAVIPLDPQTFDNGNVVRIGTATRGAPLVLVLTTEELALAQNHGEVALYRSHFASCPDAGQWRQPRTKGTL
jgi:hypothetical protein